MPKQIMSNSLPAPPRSAVSTRCLSSSSASRRCVCVCVGTQSSDRSVGAASGGAPLLSLFSSLLSPKPKRHSTPRQTTDRTSAARGGHTGRTDATQASGRRERAPGGPPSLGSAGRAETPTLKSPKKEREERRRGGRPGGEPRPIGWSPVPLGGSMAWSSALVRAGPPAGRPALTALALSSRLERALWMRFG